LQLAQFSVLVHASKLVPPAFVTLMLFGLSNRTLSTAASMRPSTAALACVVASRRTAFAAAAVMSFVALSTASLRRPSADEARVDHTA
jgi:hypothetical protein